MDGRNSFGRRISLLNDNETPRAANNLPSVVFSPQSRTSSDASTPSLSPQTPQLVRSDSTDSGAMQTPSPITPSFSFEGLPPQQQQQASPVFGAANAPFFHQPKDNALVYPPLPQHVSAWAYPHASAPQPAVFRTSHSPSSERRPSSSSKQPAKKNQYPCPMAKQFDCHDFFTTSGHAARHAKKHTGKKDAFCPECNKAFTRKDNMEQHRRTHQNGRNASKSSAEPGAKKVKPQSKRSKPAPLQAATAAMPAVDPMLPVSPASSFGFSERSLAPVVPAMQAYGQDFIQRLQYGEPMSSAPYPLVSADSAYNPVSPTFTTALDTLAIAATSTGDGLKRKAEDQ